MGESSGGPIRRGTGHGGPDDADQFPSDGRHGDRGALAVADEMAIAPMQPVLCAPRFRDHRWRLIRAMTRQPHVQGRTMAIVPSGLDEHPPRVAVAGLRECPRR